MRTFLGGILVIMAMSGVPSPGASDNVSATGQIECSFATPLLFNDHMVLQQGVPVPIWGTAAPGERISVTFQGQEKSAVAGENGAWAVRLAPMDASANPAVLTVISQSNRIEFHDVLVGEIWLCSGQSNMQASFESLNIANEIQGASYPQIRITNGANWSLCAEKDLLGFSCVGYYFGRKLHEDLKVPVGLINISQGCSSIETWMTPESLEANRDLIDQNNCSLVAEMHRFERFHATYDSLGAAEKERVFREHCQSAYGFARQFLGDDGKPKIDKYQEILLHMERVKPAWLCRERIAPAIPFSIRGVLWYQGETNIGDAQYARKQQILIESWRKQWQQGDFPFYIVQIAPYCGYAKLPEFWLEQYKAVQNTRNSGLASTVDVGELENFHPVNKRDVGLRLALLALHDAYGKSNVVCSGPTYKSLQVDGRRVRLEFDHADGGLTTKDGLPPKEFEVAGADRRFVKADASIRDNAVEITSPLEHPQYVRYAWRCLAVPNLCNKSGLPALPFNTSEAFFQWPNPP
jgi:sialate O-acetylesterase